LRWDYVLTLIITGGTSKYAAATGTVVATGVGVNILSASTGSGFGESDRV